VTVEHVPRRLGRICGALAALVVLVFGGIALLLPRGNDAVETFRPVDQVAFFCIGLVIAGGVLVLTRFRVRADEQGVWVRNSLGERFFPWPVVVAVNLPEGATWAQLELHDDETVALLALQTSDGDATIDAVIALRRLLRQSRGG
jgi:hypothetical protein